MKKCECADKGCPVHKGTDCRKTSADFETQMVRLYRVDMDDEAGTLFCDLCADDACESGLFSDTN